MSYDPFDDEFKRFLRDVRKHFMRDLEFNREFEHMEKEFRVDFGKLERIPGTVGFKIEIRDFGEGKPEIRVTRSGERQAKITPAEALKPRRPKPAEKLKVKPISKMLETNTGKIERPDEVVLTMQTPGVEKDDVEVRQLGNALEVIARKPGGEAYFGAFELPLDAAPSERTLELKEGMLIISIPRRRRYPRMRS
jgi:HSP20 family molecular chaperone IbpA